MQPLGSQSNLRVLLRQGDKCPDSPTVDAALEAPSLLHRLKVAFVFLVISCRG